jgi:hypothetical protein
MSNETALTTTGPRAIAVDPKLLEIAKHVDEIADGAMELFKGGGSFAVEIQMAKTIGALKAALKPEVMQPIMELQNTDLGFRTDQKTGYPVDVVRDVLIEAKIRGFHMTGNEINILAGRFYAAKAGLRRKVITFPGVTDFKDGYSVPKMVANGATVICSAAWKKEGIADNLDCEIPIRVNAQMGADAILGKAERKLLARVLNRLSGISTPEGEAGEDIVVEPMRAPPPPASTPASAPAPTNGSAARATVSHADRGAPPPDLASDAPAHDQDAGDAPSRPIDAVLEDFYAAALATKEVGQDKARQQLDGAMARIPALEREGKTDKSDREKATQVYRVCRACIDKGLDPKAAEAEFSKLEAQRNAGGAA